MFCDQCGALADDGALLCTRCGRELKAAAAVRAGSGWDAEPPPPAAGAEVMPEVPTPVEHPCPEHPQLPVAGTCPRCGKFVCIRCAPKAALGDLNCEACTARLRPASGGEGIGGWLVLPAIGLVVSIVSYGALAVMTASSGQLGNASLFSAMAGLNLIAASFFFRKSRHAPMVMAGLYVVGLLVNLGMGPFSPRDVVPLVWVAYFLRSERVKRTFVH